jgi:hypothetical protein
MRRNAETAKLAACAEPFLRSMYVQRGPEGLKEMLGDAQPRGPGANGTGLITVLWTKKSRSSRGGI